MKLLIAGSRHWTPDAETAQRSFLYCLEFAKINSSDILEIVHGGARGTDSAAHRWADGLWPIKVFQADWNTHGRKAGPIRNREMAEYADVLIAIKHGGFANAGTKSMIAEMEKAGKPAHVFAWLDPNRVLKELRGA